MGGADVLRGLIATSLVSSERAVHHTWHNRLELGYPVPSLNRDRGLDGIQDLLRARDVYSRGRFGAWKYEVSNQDHSFAQAWRRGGRCMAGRCRGSDVAAARWSQRAPATFDGAGVNH